MRRVQLAQRRSELLFEHVAAQPHAQRAQLAERGPELLFEHVAAQPHAQRAQLAQRGPELLFGPVAAQPHAQRAQLAERGPELLFELVASMLDVAVQLPGVHWLLRLGLVVGRAAGVVVVVGAVTEGASTPRLRAMPFAKQTARKSKFAKLGLAEAEAEAALAAEQAALPAWRV